MPTVPITGPRQLLTGQAPKPTETELMMALSEMNQLGRIAGPTVKQPSSTAQRSTNRQTANPIR